MLQVQKYYFNKIMFLLLFTNWFCYHWELHRIMYKLISWKYKEKYAQMHTGTDIISYLFYSLWQTFSCPYERNGWLIYFHDMITKFR